MISPISLANLKPAKKGEVRNPYGRPRLIDSPAVRALVDPATPAAWRTVVEIMLGKIDGATMEQRLKAATLILAYGWGKPPMELVVTRTNEEVRLNVDATVFVEIMQAYGHLAERYKPVELAAPDPIPHANGSGKSSDSASANGEASRVPDSPA